MCPLLVAILISRKGHAKNFVDCVTVCHLHQDATNSYIDVHNGCWRRFIMMPDLKCWWLTFTNITVINRNTRLPGTEPAKTVIVPSIKSCEILDELVLNPSSKWPKNFQGGTSGTVCVFIAWFYTWFR